MASITLNFSKESRKLKNNTYMNKEIAIERYKNNF